MAWNICYLKYIINGLILSDEINVFHFLELVVGDYCCGVIESHPNGVGVEQIGHTEFHILFEERYPDVGSCLSWHCHLLLHWLVQICSGGQHSSSSQSGSRSSSLTIVSISIQLVDAVGPGQ